MNFFNFFRKTNSTIEMANNRVPPGQHLTDSFPVLHYGSVPHTPLEQWDFKVRGLVKNPFTLTYEEFMALPAVEITCDIHCVTRWSKLDTVWEGIPFKELVKLIEPLSEASYVMVYGENHFSTNLPLAELMEDDVIFAYKYNGANLTQEHGWPLRLVVPKLYFWKSAKWVRGLEFMDHDEPGFWERNGYHMHGDPWKEERYR